MPVRLRLLLLFVTLLLACSSAPRPVKSQPLDANYPWRLREPAELPGDFLWEQRLTAQSAHSGGSLRVAVQKRGNNLTVIGLTPFSTKAFVLSQDGQQIEFQTFTDRELPFPPRFILIDIQRTWLALGDVANRPWTGVETFVLDAETVKQTWRSGRLIERRFVRVDGVPAGEVVIAYTDWQADGMPKLARVDNWWFGYRLDVETLAVRALQ